mmetsp:Transcript_44865/g.108877  ORF Transcript_44865/g.108877 Transcript_44865/m.108877 type:complete len:133 (-) Transcript_44865:1877-2275(-)
MICDTLPKEPYKGKEPFLSSLPLPVCVCVCARVLGISSILNQCSLTVCITTGETAAASAGGSAVEVQPFIIIVRTMALFSRFRMDDVRERFAVAVIMADDGDGVVAESAARSAWGDDVDVDKVVAVDVLEPS